jgi:hypothetical protein
MISTWQRARETIATVLKAHPAPRTPVEMKALERAISAAFPFGQRIGYQYQTWRYEVARVRERFAPNVLGAEIVVPCKTCRARRYRICQPPGFVNWDGTVVQRDAMEIEMINIAAAREVVADAERDGAWDVLPTLRTLTFHARRVDLYRGRFEASDYQAELFEPRGGAA